VNCCREGQNLKFRAFLSVGKAPCEHLDCVQKLRKYSGSRKPIEEGYHYNRGIGPQSL
jgi:hypothetical protein